MEFNNQSPYQANAIWGPHSEQEFGVCVIAKATFDCSNGKMIQVSDNPWPVHFESLETPYGVFPSEYSPFPKKRTDLIVCGKARSPEKKPVQIMAVKIEVGEFNYSIAVFGDRSWIPGLKGLSPSEPEPFTSMPLTLDHAYGGKITTEWGDLSNPNNASGRGWYFKIEQAKNAPLPNLEDPTNLIGAWNDQPVPIAPCAYTDGGGLKIDLPNNPLHPDHFVPIEEGSHGWAHPHLMLPKIPLVIGEKIRVEGVCHEGPLIAEVPAFDARVWVHCDEKKTEIPFKLDTVIIQGEENRVVFRWRGAVTFPIKPREIRTITMESNHQNPPGGAHHDA